MNLSEDYNQNIEELLPRYLDGLLTPEEEHRVEEWMAESEEHRSLVKQMNAIALAADYQRIAPGIDVQKALKRVKQGQRKRDRRFSLRYLERVAAILFIPLLTVVLVKYLSVEEVPLAQMIEMKTNPGMTTSFMLPDSTLVYLNSESSLKYPSTFDGTTRTVVLNGEAFFDVTHDAKKKFIVQTLHQTSIEVHGTRFNIEAYNSEEDVVATLIRGKISFRYPAPGEGVKSVAMSPGQRIVFDSSSKRVHLYNTSCLSEISWVDGKIVFDNTTLEDALRILEKRYNVEFVIRSLKTKDYAFTGTFTSQRLERILEYFKVSSGIRWKYIDNGDIKAGKTKVLLYK